MIKLPRRQFLQLAGGAAALPVFSHASWADTYPSRPISLIVFVPAGGSPDISARFVGQPLSQRLGQNVVIENRPGAGGSLAMQAVARAPADGYTLLLIAVPHAINVTLHEKASLKITHDIVPVAGLYTGTFLMLASPKLPVKTLPELIAYAKANPGKINMTSSGAGNLSHLSGELFKMMTGIQVVHVPYKGAVLAHTGLMSGEVHIMFDAMASALPNVKSGRLRALAVTSEQRLPTLPDIPTVAESVPGYTVTSWLGIGAPVGTPREIVELLNKDINAVLAEPEIKERFASLSSVPLVRSPEEFGKFIASEADKWGKVIRASHIKPR
jgi:tripartite-type tricarboxylate transporter receptor subunit TctC